MNKIEINKYGKIIKGEYKNWFVFIEDDQENTGGYLILIMKTKENGPGYDAWVENYEDLKEYFLESDWKIQWEN